MKWLTKGEIFISCFNFDLNRSANKEKNVFKNVYFLALSENVSLHCNDYEQGPSEGGGGSGGPREKLRTFLFRGRMIFCYHENTFLTISLLSEIFT